MFDNSNDKQANTIDEMTLLLAFRLLSDIQQQAVLNIILASEKLTSEVKKQLENV